MADKSFREYVTSQLNYDLLGQLKKTSEQMLFPTKPKSTINTFFSLSFSFLNWRYMFRNYWTSSSRKVFEHWITKTSLSIRTVLLGLSLRKHAYSNTLKILPPKSENFQIKKKSDIFQICAQNIDCGYPLEPPRRGGSNKYPQSMFWAEIRKIMYTPVNPFYYIKVGFKGVKLKRHVFVMAAIDIL